MPATIEKPRIQCRYRKNPTVSAGRPRKGAVLQPPPAGVVSIYAKISLNDVVGGQGVDHGLVDGVGHCQPGDSF